MNLRHGSGSSLETGILGEIRRKAEHSPDDKHIKMITSNKQSIGVKEGEIAIFFHLIILFIVLIEQAVLKMNSGAEITFKKLGVFLRLPWARIK